MVILYGSFIEPRLIKVTKENITLKEKNEKQIKIAFISDIHAGPYKKEKFVKKIAQITIEQNPDIVLLGGDFILGKEENGKYLIGLKELSEKYPTYAVWGNHEYNIGNPENLSKFKDKTKTLRETFQKINIKVLNNEKRLIDEKFWLLGVDSVWAQKDNLNLATEGIDNNLPKILLAHNPEVIHKTENKNIDFVLSGHTQGGQIRIPLIGTVPSLPTNLGRKYDYGLFEISDTLLYITKGAGESGPRARLFCRPEIVILNINL